MAVVDRASSNARPISSSNATPKVGEPLHVDRDLKDTVCDAASTIDDRTTIVSSIKHYKYENGRRYHSFRDGEYLLPNDEREQERLELLNHIFRMLLSGELCRAPIDNPTRVLDFGTGTGVWAIDFAEVFPQAEVLGTDLSPIQPSWFPSNCRFEVDDAESEWLYGNKPFDYIHGRGMTGGIGDWRKLIRQAYDNLRPGGWLELQEYETEIMSDDGTHLQAQSFMLWQTQLNEASRLFGKAFTDYHYHKQRMEEAGFVDVVDDAFKVPIGTWPRDRRMKEIGKFQLYQMLEAVEPFTLAVFTRVLKWRPEETRDLIDKVKAEVCNPQFHIYSLFRFVYGRKPER
ncbi:hypothetical protein UA08_01993 [Talaromyces atroroseus]|uniref:Methyltransferase n=1 Tax=Talaromyces atroroseus TaxID=1441469 RepID=A0A1Q5QAE4_TALAT|nr:hypothetical protein UA08_01993 [Talaromyces atroroseus]OKL62917.1 hypothetical protein UA08_01993 [Talaromyces atroroseus]